MFLEGGLTYNSYPLSASCVSDAVLISTAPWLWGRVPDFWWWGCGNFGRLVCWIFFRCSRVIWSSVPFPCHFWGANISRLLFLSWFMRFQHCGYQATDKGKAQKVSWYFWHSMLLCSRMFLLCVFHFWTTAVKKAGVLSFAWMLFYNLLRVTNFSFVWHEIEFSDNIAVIKFA